MEDYRFFIDSKVSTWRRDHYIVEAENEESAKQTMVRAFREKDYPDAWFIDSEQLFETDEDLTPLDNNNQPTRELYLKRNSVPEMIEDNINLEL